MRLRVGVGKDDDLQSVSLAAFGKAAETAADLRKGDRIERELVHRHRELGLRCERYPSSGTTRFRGSSMTHTSIDAANYGVGRIAFCESSKEELHRT